ncbi:MAG: alkaline phosphatase D family protein [Polyangiaceae bacterium]
MQLTEPTVGPILGAVSPSSARIFLRGELELVGQQPRWAHGAVRYKKRGDSKFGAPRFVKLNSVFDMSGVAVLEGLEADTQYEYQAGWFFRDLDTKDLSATQELSWGTVPTWSFKTASANASAPRSFVVGSCRYLLRLLGGAILDERGDKTFEAIRNQIEDGRGVDALLMLGDQIYADDLRVNGDRTVDDFYARYRDAFGTKHLRGLMQRVPTYMTLDDHEIEDGWPARATKSDYMYKYPAAMYGYQAYQLSHSPAFPVSQGRIEGTPKRFWYSFSDGCADFFVTDCRTERLLGTGNDRMVGVAQLDALKQWLSDGSGRIKFIASSVPPFGVSGSDKWDAFSSQRNELLDHISDAKVRRVVFLSGDVHASFTTELVADNDPSFKVLSIVSSAFFWPLPGLHESHFQAEGALASNSAKGFRIRRRSPVQQRNNFTRVTCDLNKLTAQVYSRKGDDLGHTTYEF